MREPDARRGVTPDSPHILVAVSGAGIVESQGMEPISFATGDAVVIPAMRWRIHVRPQWELEVMRMSLPAGTGRGAGDRPAAIRQRAVILLLCHPDRGTADPSTPLRSARDDKMRVCRRRS